MSEITLRYTVIGVGKCQKCGLIEIMSTLQGGTAEDPHERPPTIEAPDPSKVIQARNVGEQIARNIERTLRGTFPGFDMSNVQMVPGGAMVSLGSRGPGTGHGHGRNHWQIVLTEEEYKAIGPITIGDTLVQKISKEAAGRE